MHRKLSEARIRIQQRRITEAENNAAIAAAVFQHLKEVQEENDQAEKDKEDDDDEEDKEDKEDNVKEGDGQDKRIEYDQFALQGQKICMICKQQIEHKAIQVNWQNQQLYFHENHFICATCEKPLISEDFRLHEGIVRYLLKKKNI